MPRRQVRAPRPEVDLRGILLETEALPPLLGSISLFGQEQPLEIEIGSGKGLFLDQASAANPAHHFLGIEIARPYALVTAARLARRGAPNAKVILGDAGPLLASRIADHSIEALHVYFPDPWWKKKHKKRRVLNEVFFRHALRILRPGGRLHFWTDVLEYFEQALELAAEVTPELGPPIPEPAAAGGEGNGDYRTHFERRSCQQSIPVYRVYWEAPQVRGALGSWTSPTTHSW